jgi:hypothetical protein
MQGTLVVILKKKPRKGFHEFKNNKMKLTKIFVISSLIKGILLYLTILLDNIIGDTFILLKYLVFLLIVGLIDYKTITILQKIKTINIFLTGLFIYGSFIAILWITGPIFQLHNYLLEIEISEETTMPPSAIVIFLIVGLLNSISTVATWKIRHKSKLINNHS